MYKSDKLLKGETRVGGKYQAESSLLRKFLQTGLLSWNWASERKKSMKMNTRQGLTVQDAAPVRIATVHDDSKLSPRHHHETKKVQTPEQANATDDDFGTVWEGPWGWPELWGRSHYTEPSKEDHKFSTADLGLQVQES